MGLLDNIKAEQQWVHVVLEKRTHLVVAIVHDAHYRQALLHNFSSLEPLSRSVLKRKEIRRFKQSLFTLPSVSERHVDMNAAPEVRRDDLFVEK